MLKTSKVAGDFVDSTLALHIMRDRNRQSDDMSHKCREKKWREGCVIIIISTLGPCYLKDLKKQGDL